MTVPEQADAHLRAPAHRVNPRARRWWSVRSGIGTLVVLLPQLVAALVVAELTAPLLVTSAVTLAIGLAHLFVVPRWRYSLHRWEVTDDAVHTLAGWLRLEWRIAPISRIQTVDTEQGPLQRAFSLSSVTVTTASASGALHIDGLDTDEAAALAHRLTEVTEAVGGDAT